MSRGIFLSGNRFPWSPYQIPRSRLAMWLHAGDTNRISLTGGLVDSWTDRISGLAFTASGSERPTYTAEGMNGYPGVDFKSLVGNRLNNTSFSSVLPTGSSPSTLVVMASSYNLTALRARMFAYGNSGQRRSLYVTGASHRIGVDSVGGYDVTDSNISGPFVSIGEWGSSFQSVYWNGQDGGGNATTLTTGTTRATVGASNADVGRDWFDGVISDVLLIRGTLSSAERQLIQRSLLDDYDLAFDVLAPGTPLAPAGPRQYVFATNISDLNTQIAAADGQPTPNTSPPMADPPVVTFSDSSSLPTGLTQECKWSTTPNMMRWWGGWKSTVGGVYRASPAGYLGVLGGVQFLLATCQRLELEITDEKMAFSLLRSSQKPRVIIDGEVISPTGEETTSLTRWLILDFAGHGGVATRKIVIEGESSNSIAGVAVTAAGRVSMTSAAPQINNLFVLGDSFTRSTGATRTWLGYVPQLADFLGFRNFFADGVVGGGWIKKASSDLTNALERVNDVTDRDVARRNSLGATGLSTASCVLIALGINDAGYTQSEIEDQVNLVLDQIQGIIPGVPILVTGPWNPIAPSPYTSSLEAIDLGIQAACSGRSGVAYLDIESMVFDQVGDGNIHPNDDGHAQIAAALSPMIRDALLLM